MNRVTIRIVEVFVVNTPAYVGFFAGFILNVNQEELEGLARSSHWIATPWQASGLAEKGIYKQGSKVRIGASLS